ncbi:SAM-dependent methyltransferase [Desulfomarina profundi]|uniref:SAM-dependent methyltransferase n=1 Tax=Desulfomarina profundi TaxID=2772557 RepID=A0A8D5FSW5_9BACT|nr:methyltransferase [Desulfomarina profundi]BCL60806.1 SAM-dependent methyltransferase [Desulfomarina profundi]
MVDHDRENRELTEDTLFNGRLVCYQHKEGYRFSIDSVLLAHFTTVKKGDCILDLGSGCGILGLILMYRHGSRIASITAVEIQISLAALTEKNFMANGFDRSCSVYRADIRNLFDYCQRGSFSKVICNPPFYRSGRGRVSVNEESLLARHQISCSLTEFLAVAAAAVKNRGSVYFIYPATELAELIQDAKKYGLEPKQIRFVYSYPGRGKSAELVLISFLKNGGPGVDIMRPLHIYEEKNGEYDQEVVSYYE